MSWLFSQALVEEYLGDTYSDGEQSAPLSGSPTQQAYCAPDKMTKFSRLSRFGMTFKPLTADRGEELLTLYLAAFHAKTSAPQERAQESTEPDPECGVTWRELLARYDQNTSSWRTPQCSLLGDSIEFSGTWPRWGSMQDGVSYQQQPLVRHTKETGSGLWRTPSAQEPGVSAERLVPIEGGTPGGMNRHFDKHTGRMAQIGLEQQIKLRAMTWPTPRSNDAEKRGNFDEMNPRNGLPGAVKKWPTPAARDGNPTNTLETLMEGRFVDQLANRVKMVENNLWTTPCSRDWKGKTITKNHPEGFNKSLANDVIKSTTTPDSPASGQLNPTWVEWLMAWPLGWTDLKPLETDKFRSWQQQHGVSSSEET
jgi:DNA (cytosine-5)-methyltransferase 1